MKIVNQLFIVFLLLMTSSISIAEIRYLHTDMMGSVISVSDEQGNIISRNHYAPFGKRIGGEKEGIGYTGHLQDTDLGLTYMQARYYDPLIGRFYSNDPVDAMGHITRGNPIHGFNRYTYANNNPYKYTDPNGENPLIAFGALVGAISATATTYIQSGGNASWQELGASAVGGAAVGALAGATMGMSLASGTIATMATTGIASGAGDAISQGIIKGPENIDVVKSAGTGIIATVGGAVGKFAQAAGAGLKGQIVATEVTNIPLVGAVVPLAEDLSGRNDVTEKVQDDTKE